MTLRHYYAWTSQSRSIQVTLIPRHSRLFAFGFKFSWWPRFRKVSWSGDNNPDEQYTYDRPAGHDWSLTMTAGVTTLTFTYSPEKML